MSAFVPVKARGLEELKQKSSPSGAEYFAFRAPLYDTQPYTTAVTVTQTFFQAIQADKTLSNVRGNGGIMPNNIFFEPLWMNVDILIAATAGAGTTAGALNDVAQLVYTGRGTSQIVLGSSNYPQIPISYCHASGGPIGNVSASLTAPANIQYAVNGAQDSGYSVADSFMISPMVPFAVILTWAAALTIAAATPQIRVSFDGNWYLPVQ